MRGNPHAAFDEAGAGNAARSRWCDTRRRKSEPTGNTNFDLNRRASPRPYQAKQARSAETDAQALEEPVAGRGPPVGGRNGVDILTVGRGAADRFLVVVTPSKNVAHGLLRT